MEWTVDPTFVRLGAVEIRYYGVLVLFGLACATWAALRCGRTAGLPRGPTAAATIAASVMALFGAHAAHLVFYEPDAMSDLDRWLRIGSGFASHGAFAAGLITVAIHALLARLPVWTSLDAAMSGAVVLTPFFRAGNLMNSEIVGRVWSGPWAMRFPLYDCRHEVADCSAPPRHPVQIYELLAGVAVVALAVYLQRTPRERRRPGLIFALLLCATFVLRLVTEAFKEDQGTDPIFALTMGQVLSLPLFAAGLLMLIAFAPRTRPAPT